MAVEEDFDRARWPIKDCTGLLFVEKWLMNSNRFLLSSLAAFAALLMMSVARAESTVSQAFQVARGAVNPAMQTHVVSIYGTGAPGDIEKWYIIFYDPSIPSHGRAVLVENGQIVKTYAANGGAVYRSDLTFDPSRLTPEGPALTAAQDYATRHNISYDSVRALLKETSLDRPFRWRIELMNDGRSKGYVFINALDSSVASYASSGSSTQVAESSSTTTTTTSRSNSDDNDNSGGFGNDVKRTFLGIGGDLQEFFTGERTVDK
jgi:hypothetical protein